jgi:beta-N-acetylhexosaminidase
VKSLPSPAQPQPATAARSTSERPSSGPRSSRSSRQRGRALAAPLGLALALGLVATGCTAQPPGGGQTGPTSGPGSSADGTPGAGQGSAPASELERVLAGPSEETKKAARAEVGEMDTAERAGQVLVGQLGAAGTDPASLRDLNLGGVIAMGDAVPVAADGTHDLPALASRLTAAQEALSSGRDWAGIIGVDQEGGLVSRVKEPLVEWPTPMSYGAADAGTQAPADSLLQAATGHRQMGAQLADLGFTVDFAPSVDVTIGAGDPAIGARSFSADPEAVSRLGVAATAGLLHAGVLPSPKHFPGHGSVTEDSHVTAPEQEANAEELQARDWLPFAALLGGEDHASGSRQDPAAGPDGGAGSPGSGAAAAGPEAVYAPMVMMGHIVVPELDPGVPASVSPAAYEALRQLGAAGGADTAGYDGVVVTDALNMGALVERYGANEAPVRALAAGADLLLMPSSIPGARDAVVAAVESGEVPEERLRQAAERVVTMLMWRDDLATELDEATPEERAAVGIDEAAGADPAETSRALSAAAVTVVDGVCGEPLVRDSLRIAGGTGQDRARLAAAAEDAGLAVGSGPLVQLLGSARGSGQGDVVVALDAPFGLAGSSAPDDGALVALYGRTPGAFEALVDVLTGRAEAPGALPVEVGPWPAGTGCGTPDAPARG